MGSAKLLIYNLLSFLAGMLVLAAIAILLDRRQSAVIFDYHLNRIPAKEPLPPGIW